MAVATAGRWLVHRRSRGQVRIAVASAAAAVMLVAGCQVPWASSPAGQGSSGSSVTVASVRGIGSAPLYIALQEGLFRQAGLTVRVRSYPSVAAEVTALRSGEADAAVGD